MLMLISSHMSIANKLRTWVPRIAVILLAIAIIVMLAFAYSSHRANMAMLDAGLQTEGTVLRTEYLGPSRGPQPMYVTLRYVIQNRSYTHTIRVGGEAYALATANTTLPLYYSATDPWNIAISYPGIRNELTEEFIARVVVGSGILFFSILIGVVTFL